MAKKYRGEAFAAIHETMEALHEVGAIEKQTMREFDDACLTPVHVLNPDEIKSIRVREHISQPVFARYLNVSKTWFPIGNVGSRNRVARPCVC